MKVKELINELKEFPDDMEVFFRTDYRVQSYKSLEGVGWQHVASLGSSNQSGNLHVSIKGAAENAHIIRNPNFKFGQDANNEGIDEDLRDDGITLAKLFHENARKVILFR